MTISFAVELPTHRVESPSEFVTAAAITDVAQAAERAGYAAVYVTDHPAPDTRWLETEGHHALDPFVALSFAAAVTTRIGLLTNVYIATYRNPFLGAKSVQSLQVLSDGRLILGTAVGYLKPEFRALGVGYDDRGARLDEALDVLVKVLSGDDIAYDGSTFRARGVRLRPVPTSAPPIWVGGNSKVAIRRAVARFQGWAPFNTMGYAMPTRASELASIGELEASIEWAKTYAREIGRTDPLDICFSVGNLLDDDRSTDERHATIERLEAAGVTWLTIAPPGPDRAEVIERAQMFAAEFISR